MSINQAALERTGANSSTRAVRAAIFISGRGSNMKALIESSNSGVLSGLFHPVVVVSDNPLAKGLDYAREMGIPTICSEADTKNRETFDREIVSLLTPYKPDFIILAGYRRIVSPYFVKCFPDGIINIHPADSRKFHGLNGYQWAFNNQLKKTTITVHYVDDGVDTGEIISQTEVDISSAGSLEEVESLGLKAEHEFFPRVLAELFRGRKQLCVE